MSDILFPNLAIDLRALRTTDANLQHAVSEVATGKDVATPEDNGPAYVIANQLGSDAQAYATVKSGLGGAEVPTRVANAAIDGITDVLMKLKDTAIEAQSGGIFASAADTQIQSLLYQITDYETDATVPGGVNLLAGAVVNGVTTTQIRVPSDLNGNNITIGDKGLSQMNASVPGRGLASFSATSDGTQISFSSLSVENISTAAPATQVEVFTGNYPNGMPQYPAQSWKFQFTDASNPIAASTIIPGPPDAAGNVLLADHIIPVPLPAGFTLNDAITALQQAMYGAGFETQFATSPPPTLSVAGNNVGIGPQQPVDNLRPTFPIPVAQTSPVVLTSSAVVVPPPPASAPTQISVKLPSLPSGEPPSSLAGASYLSTPAEIAAYKTSNPTTPAFYLSPPVPLPPSPPSPPFNAAAIATGTTIQLVQPDAPPTPQTSTITLSTGVQASIPAGSSFGLLVPLPVTPVATSADWPGPEGVIATLNSAMRKTGDMSQRLGNDLDALQEAQDHASQSVDVLNTDIGNLTDADLGKESARLQALQVQQQLASQSLALGNQWQKLLLQLFK